MTNNLTIPTTANLSQFEAQRRDDLLTLWWSRKPITTDNRTALIALNYKNLFGNRPPKVSRQA